MKQKLYYTKALLEKASSVCLNCPTKPCMKACPIGCDPCFFIQKIKEGDYETGAKSIREKNPLGEICGLVCPEKFCMKACLRSKIDYPVNIKKIQASLLHEIDEKRNSIPEKQQEKMAVIGAGPAGIGAAVTFVKNGFLCTLFEETEKIGGMIHLIPKSKLPAQVIEKEMDKILSLPFLSVQTHKKIKDPLQLLQEGYDYVVSATGEKNIKQLGVLGEEYAVSCFDFLKKNILNLKQKKVAIIGGGNVALDCVKVLKEAGVTEIEMFIRRPFYLMRVEKERVFELMEEQVNIHPMFVPVKIEKKENKYALVVARTILKNNQPVKTDELSVYDDFDLVIKATGLESEEKISHNRLFYAGDCQTGASTVVESLAHGVQVAHKIIDPLLKLK